MRLRRDLRASVRHGLWHIAAGNATQKALAFVLTIVLVHVLSKSAFGQYSYARTIVNFLFIFGGLGIQSGILQYCTRASSASKRAAYLRYGLRVEVLTGLVLGGAVLLACSSLNLPVPGSAPLLMVMAFLPLAYHLSEAGLQYLRTRLLNRQYAYLRALSAALGLILVSLGARLFAARGAAAFAYPAYLISALVTYGLIRAELVKSRGGALDRREKRAFLNYSASAMLTSGVSQVLFVIDTLLVGLIIVDPETVATYKTATAIPLALNFIPQSVMAFVFPYLVKMGKDELRSAVARIQGYLGILNVAISGLLVLLAPHIIRLVFGPEYVDAVVPFRILSVVYFLAGTFRLTVGTAIASQLRMGYNLFVGVLTTVLNIGLDFWLISMHGIAGAALATLLSLLFSVGLSNYLFYRHVLREH